MTDFTTMTLERQIACAPDRLFRLLTTKAGREAWGAPSDTAVVIIDAFDCRPGGHEKARCGPKEAPEFETHTAFHRVDPACLVSTESLIIGGELLSTSLCTHDIAARDGGTHLTVTLQIASFAGPDLFDDYAQGWTGALDSLTRLATEPANA
ncbi:SRPBCC family protein [Sagittula sp.]|uniref:SRPBCC family protein n=1 Tax=Sagittula sp. TaxID=2038081 RepID=UPI003516302A